MFIVTKEIDSENISKLCRTCLREDGDKMVCLFVGPAGSSLAAKLRSLSCLEVGAIIRSYIQNEFMKDRILDAFHVCRSGKGMACPKKCAIVASPEQNQHFCTGNNVARRIKP